METSKSSNKKAYVFGLGIVFLIIVSGYVGSVATLAAFATFLVSVVLLPRIDVYIVLFAIFPFANLFKISPSAMSLLTVCELILFVLMCFDFIQGKIKFKSSFLFALMLFAAYLLIGSLNDFSFPVFAKMIVRPFLLYYLFNSKYSFEKKEKVAIGIACILSLSMILMMIVSLNISYMERIVDYLRVVQMQSGLQELTRNGGLLDDPNYCSLAILMTLSLLSVLYYSKKIGNVFWLFSVPLIVMGFTTYSKSYFICIIIYIVLLIMLVLFPKHPFWAIVTALVVSIVSIAVIRGRIEVVEVILQRFNVKDVTSGRTRLNEIYLRYLQENPVKMIFGNGIATHTISGYNNVHNLFIECLYKIGIVGSVIYILLLKSCMLTKEGSKKIIAYLPVVFMIIMYFALAGLVTFELMYYLMICGMAAKYIQSKPEGDMIDEKI